VGFREIRVEGTRILLNGRDVFLKGISVHEDDFETGRVTSKSDIERRFRHAKELGCNFLRLTHYPHHEDVARLADAEGLLLWEEIPVYWAVEFADPHTYADAETQLLELVRRDRNRASVIVWSIGNENADTDLRLSFMSRLADATREADPTRPVAAACLLDFKNLRIADRMTEHLDIIGINEYYGWYLPDMNDLVAIGRNSAPTKPVIISETGAGAVAGRKGPQGALFTETRMADVYHRQLAVIATLDYVRGLTPWVLYDFRSERRQNPFQRGFNRKGLIAEDKATRKAAFDVLAAFYRSR
jgi:beta-glucuronidase